jgi:cell division septal protein FtsQ
MVHERTKETKEPRRHTRFVYTLIFLLLSGVVYLLIFSGYFDINQLEISGYKDTKLIEEMTARGIGTGFLEKNILFINTTDLEKTIKDGSGARVVEVARRLPDKIYIRIEESVGVLVWNTVGESFFIDERGYVIEKNNNKDLPQVFDNANIPVTLGERVASPTLIKFIIDASNNFEPVVGQKIAKIIIYDILTDVHIKSVSG